MIAERPAAEPKLPLQADNGELSLQVLVAEHWSLLATRALSYNESLSRVAMFLAVLSGAVVGLALLAQVDHFSDGFHIAAILILSVVVFVGLATIARLSAINREDWRCVMGMNRLRRGYLDMHPHLEPYFLTGCHDDLHGLMLTMDMHMTADRWSPRQAAHGFQTLPTMVGVVVALVAGVLGALVASWFGGSSLIVLITAAAIFLGTVVGLGLWTQQSFITFARQMPTRFPSPGTNRR